MKRGFEKPTFCEPFCKPPTIGVARFMLLSPPSYDVEEEPDVPYFHILQM